MFSKQSLLNSIKERKMIKQYVYLFFLFGNFLIPIKNVIFDDVTYIKSLFILKEI